MIPASILATVGSGGGTTPQTSYRTVQLISFSYKHDDPNILDKDGYRSGALTYDLGTGGKHRMEFINDAFMPDGSPTSVVQSMLDSGNPDAIKKAKGKMTRSAIQVKAIALAAGCDPAKLDEYGFDLEWLFNVETMRDYFGVDISEGVFAGVAWLGPMKGVPKEWADQNEKAALNLRGGHLQSWLPVAHAQAKAAAGEIPDDDRARPWEDGGYDNQAQTGPSQTSPAQAGQSQAGPGPRPAPAPAHGAAPRPAPGPGGAQLPPRPNAPAQAVRPAPRPAPGG